MKSRSIQTARAAAIPAPAAGERFFPHAAVKKELSGGERSTTNNRMELTAVIRGLQALKRPCKVTVVTDSKYVADAVTLGWAKKWKAQGWMRNKKEKALNPDLWEELLTLLSIHEVTFSWVKGHAGHPENERCDEMAVAAYQNLH